MNNGRGQDFPFEDLGGPGGGNGAGGSDLNLLGLYFEKQTSAVPPAPERPPDERTETSFRSIAALVPRGAETLADLVDLRSLSSFATINDIIDTTHDGFSTKDRGYLYGIDPVSGNVRSYPTNRTSLWTNDDSNRQQLLDQRGYSYGVDPLTGGVRTFPNSRTDLWTSDDAKRAAAIEQRGFYFALDPWSGRISRFSSRPRLE